MVYRDFNEGYTFSEEEKYTSIPLEKTNYRIDENELVLKTPFTKELIFTETKEYHELFNIKYNKLTKKDHLWIKASLSIKLPENIGNKQPLLVFSMERKEGAYGYFARQIKSDLEKNGWRTFSISYLTPNIRDKEDRLKTFVWNKEKIDFEIRDLKIEVFERKNYNY